MVYLPIFDGNPEDFYWRNELPSPAKRSFHFSPISAGNEWATALIPSRLLKRSDWESEEEENHQIETKSIRSDYNPKMFYQLEYPYFGWKPY